MDGYFRWFAPLGYPYTGGLSLTPRHFLDQAVADKTAADKATVDAETAKQAADRATAASDESASKFAHVIQAQGGKITDTQATPAIVYSTSDGVTYQQTTVPTLDTPLPEPAADQAEAEPGRSS